MIFIIMTFYQIVFDALNLATYIHIYSWNGLDNIFQDFFLISRFRQFVRLSVISNGLLLTSYGRLFHSRKANGRRNVDKMEFHG